MLVDISVLIKVWGITTRTVAGSPTRSENIVSLSILLLGRWTLTRSSREGLEGQSWNHSLEHSRCQTSQVGLQS